MRTCDLCLQKTDKQINRFNEWFAKIVHPRGIHDLCEKCMGNLDNVSLEVWSKTADVRSEMTEDILGRLIDNIKSSNNQENQ